jgi:hypothetical protein
MPLETFAKAGLLLEVRSSELCDVVLFASDNTEIDPQETRVVYRVKDLADLLGKDLDAFHTLYEIKLICQGSQSDTWTRLR